MCPQSHLFLVPQALPTNRNKRLWGRECCRGNKGRKGERTWDREVILLHMSTNHIEVKDLWKPWCALMANHTCSYLKNLFLSFFQIMIISIFSALLLLISSSLLIYEVTHLANYPTMLGEVDLCESLRNVGKQTCGHLQISAVSSSEKLFLPWPKGDEINRIDPNTDINLSRYDGGKVNCPNLPITSLA